MNAFKQWLTGTFMMLAVTSLLTYCNKGGGPTDPLNPPEPPLTFTLKTPHPGTYVAGQDTLFCPLFRDIESSKPMTGLVTRWWVSTPLLGVEQIHCGQKRGSDPRLFLVNEFGDYLLPYLVPRGCGACVIILSVHAPTSIPGDAGFERARDSVHITVESP